MTDSLQASRFTRRGLLAGAGAVFGGGLLSGCAGTTPFTPPLAAISAEKIAALPPADRTLVFHLAAGSLTETNGQFICDARSGKGNHRNNGASCGGRGLDPIPKGWWSIQPRSYGEKIKRDVMLLMPMRDPVTGVATSDCGRSELCLHELFYNKTVGGVAYEDEENTAGCVGVGRTAIETLFAWRARGQIARLHVV